MINLFWPFFWAAYKWLPLQYSCLGNSTDRGALEAPVHRVRKSQPWLSQVNGNSSNMHGCALLGSFVMRCHLRLVFQEEGFETEFQFSSLAQSCPALCYPKGCIMLASLSLTISQSLPKFMSTELVMPYNHPILCHPLLLLLSAFPSIQVFSNESAVVMDYLH